MSTPQGRWGGTFGNGRTFRGFVGETRGRSFASRPSWASRPSGCSTTFVSSAGHRACGSTPHFASVRRRRQLSGKPRRVSIGSSGSSTFRRRRYSRSSESGRGSAWRFGGVAERHLHKALSADSEVKEIRLGQQEGPPDFFLNLRTMRRSVSVECKNASPKTYAEGTPKVETQKTRASKGDPKSRLYDPGQFDVLAAACTDLGDAGSSATSAPTCSTATLLTLTGLPRFSASTTHGRPR